MKMMLGPRENTLLPDLVPSLESGDWNSLKFFLRKAEPEMAHECWVALSSERKEGKARK